MNGLNKTFKASLLTFFLLFGTFTLGLVRAMIDSGKIKLHMPIDFLYLHIAFALSTGALSLFLFSLAKNTGLIFPKILASINLAVISTAGIAGISYLLADNDTFTMVMLYSFEIAFGVSSMLIGYLYCFYRTCFR